MDKKSVYKLIEDHYREKAELTTRRIGRYLRNRANAEDVVQEAYTRMCAYWKSYDPEQSMDHWFGTILNNSIKAFFKADMLKGMSDDMPNEDPLANRVFDKIEADELMEIINGKSEGIRKILHLYLVEGFTSAEVEEVVPQSASNVRKIVQRFRDEVACHGRA